MALDFHHKNTNKLIFSLTETDFNLLKDIFDLYFYRTGLQIDYYQDQYFGLENLKIFIQVIKNYLENTNFNMNKNKIIAVIRFQTMLEFCLEQHWEIKTLAD